MDGTDREESADKIVKWSGEETKGSATEEEAETAGGWGGSKTRTAMARVPDGSGAGELPGGAAAGGGNTWDVTSEAADEAGAGGRHGAKQG